MVDYLFIENASSKVASEIGCLYREAGWWDEAPNHLETVKKMVRQSHCFLVAMAQSSIVGIGRAVSDGVSDAYIQDVTVRPDWQRRGVAGSIVKKIVKRLRTDGIDWIGVVAERGTHLLYESLGFAEIPDSKALLLEVEPDELSET